MTILQVVFLVSAFITLVSAVMVVSLRQMMRASLAFVLSLVGVAVIFTIIGSGFFAVTQVIVYIGAISILIIFSVMLIHNVMDVSHRQINRGAIFVGIAVVILFSGLVLAMAGWENFQTLPPATATQADDMVALGKAFTDPEGFVLPFEMISMLLLAALIGGVFIARDRKDR